MRAGKAVLLLLMVAALSLCTLCSAMADVKPIPMDMLEHGIALPWGMQCAPVYAAMMLFGVPSS